MDTTSSRRALLEAIAFGADVSGHERLRALELLDRLDERDRPDAQVPPTPEDVDAELQKFDELCRFVVETGYADSEINRRLEERVAEELRARLAVVEAQRSQAAETTEETYESSVEPEAVSEPESEPEVHPLDERSFRMLAHDEPPEPPSILY